MAGDGRRVDDLSALTQSLELCCCSLNSPQDAVDVDAPDLGDLFRRRVGDRADESDSRVVDDDVESAQFLVCMFDGCVNPRAIADVGDKRRCTTADLSDLVGNRIQLGLVEVDQRDVGAVVGEAESDSASDALAGAGDQYYLARDAHAVSPRKQ